MNRYFGAPTTLDDIIQTALLELARHPLMLDPPVVYSNGDPARVVKFRDFSGVEVKEPELTLSVFPYHYEGTSRPTPESRNASTVYRPYGLGGGEARKDQDAQNIAVSYLKVRLSLLGYTISEPAGQASEQSVITGPFGIPIQTRTFETNDNERVLRRWMEYLRTIIEVDLFSLKGLVKTSQVNWINFPTTQWDHDGDSILHVAELLWQMEYFPLKDYNRPGINRWTDELVGSLQADGAPVWYLPQHDVLMTGFGRVLLTDPKGTPLSWDVDPDSPTKAKTFVDARTRLPLSEDSLEIGGVPFINTQLIPIGVLTTGPVFVYYDKRTGTMLTHEGTAVTTLPSGKTIAWNATLRQLVYGTQEVQAGVPVKTEDLIDPRTGDIYLNTAGFVTTMNLGASGRLPGFREFLVFTP